MNGENTKRSGSDEFLREANRSDGIDRVAVRADLIRVTLRDGRAPDP